MFNDDACVLKFACYGCFIMTNLLNLLEKKKIIFLLFMISAVFVFSTAIPKGRILKKHKEIEHITEKDYRFILFIQIIIYP